MNDETKAYLEAGKQTIEGFMEGLKHTFPLPDGVQQAIKRAAETGERLNIIMPRGNGRTEVKRQFDAFVKREE